MRNYELIVFDWDGTVIDSTAAIVRAMRAACRDLDLPQPADERARSVIGLGLAQALTVAVPELPQSRLSEIVERYRFHYHAQDEDIDLFDGMADLLASLSEAGLRLAVATGKSRRGLDRALARTGLYRLFHATRCADECFSKPHPQMLEELMDELGAERGTTLMIGDTTHDLLMARNAGVGAVGVTYGAHHVALLAECDPLACVDSVRELSAWLDMR